MDGADTHGEAIVIFFLNPMHTSHLVIIEKPRCHAMWLPGKVRLHLLSVSSIKSVSQSSIHPSYLLDVTRAPVPTNT